MIQTRSKTKRDIKLYSLIDKLTNKNNETSITDTNNQFVDCKINKILTFLEMSGRTNAALLPHYLSERNALHMMRAFPMDECNLNECTLDDDLNLNLNHCRLEILINLYHYNDIEDLFINGKNEKIKLMVLNNIVEFRLQYNSASFLSKRVYYYMNNFIDKLEFSD